MVSVPIVLEEFGEVSPLRRLNSVFLLSEIRQSLFFSISTLKALKFHSGPIWYFSNVLPLLVLYSKTFREIGVNIVIIFLDIASAINYILPSTITYLSPHGNKLGAGRVVVRWRINRGNPQGVSSFH